MSYDSKKSPLSTLMHFSIELKRTHLQFNSTTGQSIRFMGGDRLRWRKEVHSLVGGASVVRIRARRGSSSGRLKCIEN